ncbi:uncharacterized protein LOC113295216 [Papaver somniferum]|uniref:uncharacterized protein LOC113295216 n=1 Tax=Papaver somniferum TaxID=3469 RepID=UPI000E6F7AF0|nr:uncharacterized protein LOC113295216 [Papaver somniferum]
MNSLKCAFGVSSGKFLGFQVTAEGIKVDPSKTQAILMMPPPQTVKELQSFMGKVNYIRRFIPGLAQLVAVFTPLLKKGANFIWTATQQEAFQKIQRILSSPAIMRSPVQGKPLCLYIAFSDTAIGDLLAQKDDEGIERPIYYFSRILRDAELRTTMWLLQMSELDITHTSPRDIRGQAVADLLAAFPGEGTTGLHEDLPGEFPDISVVEEEAWIFWGMDIIGKINPSSSKQHEYIITATEYFTKWVEFIPLRGITGATIAAFIKEHIICRFIVPKHIITDNGTPFANKQACTSATFILHTVLLTEAGEFTRTLSIPK